MKIRESELIINSDGSIFHLHLLPEDIADTIILVGDPERVNMISDFFEKVELCKQNREFYTKTGIYKNKRFTILSTGIGTDNIDIVLNELDALVNINLKTRRVKKELTSLRFVRIGTTGGLQPELPVNSFLLSSKSIGFDGLLNFYADRNKVVDKAFEEVFVKQTNWSKNFAAPYVVDADETLNKLLKNPSIIEGVTISANGFYAPQGRELRLPVYDSELIDKITSFKFYHHRITNFEMESSAIFGLSKLLGHKAACICLIIANRITKQANKNYKPHMKKLAQTVLDSLLD